MYRCTSILVLSLVMLLVCTPVSGVKSSQIVEKKGYEIIETARVTYFVSQTLIGVYGQENFSKLLKLVDDRFEDIRNITFWSSEKFYGNKLEVTVELPENTSEGIGGYGSARILISPDFLTNKTYEKTIINLFLHEMTHGITPPTIRARPWLTEGFAVFLSNEVQVFFGDKTQEEADGLYEMVWRQYVENDYLDFFFNLNRTIQEGYGSYITAWILNNITKTYGWATHERFFADLPDEYLFYMPSFSLSAAESTSYNYCLDSLIVGYYSLATETSLYSSFRSWGVKNLPNPITIINLNGTRTQNQTYTSKVVANLFGFGDDVINKIEYSFDQKVWNIYSESFSLSDDTFLYCRSTDNKGNIGPTSSITLNFESNNSMSTEPLLNLVTFATVASAVIACIVVLLYLKRKHKAESTSR
jgi:hypothetical protein